MVILFLQCQLTNSLHIADFEGDVERVDEIVSKHEEMIHVRGQAARTALHDACQSGSIGLVDRLLAYSPVDIHVVLEQNYKRSLDLVAEAGHSSIANKLLYQGASWPQADPSAKQLQIKTTSQQKNSTGLQKDYGVFFNSYGSENTYTDHYISASS